MNRISRVLAAITLGAGVALVGASTASAAQTACEATGIDDYSVSVYCNSSIGQVWRPYVKCLNTSTIYRGPWTQPNATARASCPTNSNHFLSGAGYNLFNTPTTNHALTIH